MFAGRDWKQYPLTRDEARAIRDRDREERARDWAEFRKRWPMVVAEILIDVGGGTALGFLAGIALFLLGLSELARGL